MENMARPRETVALFFRFYVNNLCRCIDKARRNMLQFGYTIVENDSL